MTWDSYKYVYYNFKSDAIICLLIGIPNQSEVRKYNVWSKGNNYNIDYEQSRDGVDVYTKTGYPDKIFVKNMKTKQLTKCIYGNLRKTH